MMTRQGPIAACRSAAKALRNRGNAVNVTSDVSEEASSASIANTGQYGSSRLSLASNLSYESANSIASSVPASVANTDHSSSQTSLSSQSTMSVASNASRDSTDSMNPIHENSIATDLRKAWMSEVRAKRLLPIWEGVLKQKKSSLSLFKKSTQAGSGSDVWRDRLVRLDVKSDLLCIWRLTEGQENLASGVMSAKFRSEARGPPKKAFALSCIRSLDSDPQLLEIRISFSAQAGEKKAKHTLQFQAPTLNDYDRWMFVLRHFGLQHDIPGLDVEMRGLLTRAFTWESELRPKLKRTCPSGRFDTYSNYTRSGQSISGASGSTESIESYFFQRETRVDDKNQVHRTPVSDNTMRHAMSDDDFLDVLSTTLDEISPCNSEWCSRVGLEPKKKAKKAVKFPAVDENSDAMKPEEVSWF